MEITCAGVGGCSAFLATSPRRYLVHFVFSDGSCLRQYFTAVFDVSIVQEAGDVPAPPCQELINSWPRLLKLFLANVFHKGPSTASAPSARTYVPRSVRRPGPFVLGCALPLLSVPFRASKWQECVDSELPLRRRKG